MTTKLRFQIVAEVNVGPPDLSETPKKRFGIFCYKLCFYAAFFTKCKVFGN